jgi:beta-xylosidase
VDFKAPLFDNGWSCIDGHIFVDADGTPYLYFTKVGVTDPPPKRFLLGINHGVKLKPDLSGIDGEPVLCTRADQPWELPESGRSRCTEGPFVLRNGDTFYMTYSANHYAEPFYGIGYATAPSPLGPWTKSPDNPLVSQKPELGISGPGHNCVIKAPDGTLFMVYHAHADPEQPSGRRTVNLDRLELKADGRLNLIGPTRSPQPLPFAR